MEITTIASSLNGSPMEKCSSPQIRNSPTCFRKFSSFTKRRLLSLKSRTWTPSIIVVLIYSLSLILHSYYLLIVTLFTLYLHYSPWLRYTQSDLNESLWNEEINQVQISCHMMLKRLEHCYFFRKQCSAAECLINVVIFVSLFVWIWLWLTENPFLVNSVISMLLICKPPY